MKKNSNKEKRLTSLKVGKPDLDFRKLVDKLEQAEITMKLDDQENLRQSMFLKFKEFTLL